MSTLYRAPGLLAELKEPIGLLKGLVVFSQSEASAVSLSTQGMALWRVSRMGRGACWREPGRTDSPDLWRPQKGCQAASPACGPELTGSPVTPMSPSLHPKKNTPPPVYLGRSAYVLAHRRDNGRIIASSPRV